MSTGEPLDDLDDPEEMSRLSSIISKLISNITKNMSDLPLEGTQQTAPYAAIENTHSYGTRTGRNQQPRPKEEPLTEVVIAQESVHVITEMRGVKKRDIRISAKAESVTISAEESGIPARIVYMPCMIASSDAPEASYNNGILELTFRRMRTETTHVFSLK